MTTKMQERKRKRSPSNVHEDQSEIGEKKTVVIKNMRSKISSKLAATAIVG